MLTVDTLRAFGANTEEGLGRCLNNEAFYLRLVGKGLADANFDRLKDAIASGDVTAAFEAAHALKGTTGNLALTPIFNPVSELTEKLRGQMEMSDVAALSDEIFAQLEKARNL